MIFRHAPSAANAEICACPRGFDRGRRTGEILGDAQSVVGETGQIRHEELRDFARSLGLDLGAFEQALTTHAYRPVKSEQYAVILKLLTARTAKARAAQLGRAMTALGR
jgi:hypothetical protein